MHYHTSMDAPAKLTYHTIRRDAIMRGETVCKSNNQKMKEKAHDDQHQDRRQDR